MLKDRYSALSKVEQRVFWITLVFSASIAVFAASVFGALLGASNLQTALVNAMPALVSDRLVGAILIFYGRKEWAAWDHFAWISYGTADRCLAGRRGYRLSVSVRTVCHCSTCSHATPFGSKRSHRGLE